MKCDIIYKYKRGINMCEKVKITTEYITLGQFLKYKNIIESGAMAKMYLQENPALVNGELENRRGRKIYPGYKVQVENNEYEIV